ncbi:MAG: helix-turn-helix transcriptional regulator [Pirellulaceae bacterium]
MTIPSDPQAAKQHYFRFATQFLRAARECDAEILEVVARMGDILLDDQSSDEERQMAVDTIEEALFPGIAADESDGMTLWENSEESQSVLQRMDEQESQFASQVVAIMKRLGMNQQQLAEAIGITQPAVSLLLTRQCRPQKRTVRKVAQALGVTEEEIWPTA